MSEVHCHCIKKHSKNCGCLTQDFVRKARTNFSLIIGMVGNDRDAFMDRLRLLSNYHAQDIHKFEGKLHPLIVCSCGKCKKDGELECKGKPYKCSTKHALTCPFHCLAYVMECQARINQVDEIIHDSLGPCYT